MTVPIDQFGKDHWSTFAYIETRTVDYGGRLDREHMRCDPGRHPQFANSANLHANEFGGPKKYPTRLRGGVELPDHDDWDCANDLEAAGLLRREGPGLRPVFKMTDEGYRVGALLRRHKAAGKNFSEFVYEPVSTS